jgi:putative transposase
MLAEFPQLKKRYWGQHLWARGYWVASSGDVTDKVWKAYIENQKPSPDDDFSVL